MKQVFSWLVLSATVAATISSGGAALSQVVSITPTFQPVQLSGTSGGEQKNSGCVGYTSPSPNHTIQVSEEIDLEFTLQASGQPALLIRGAGGKEFCVPAARNSGGKIQIPGRWSKGSYLIFVGDRENGRHPYTLTISRS
jgi:hypothetical protein